MRLGRAEVALLGHLNKALNSGGNLGVAADGLRTCLYDPGAEAPRKTLDRLVTKGLAVVETYKGQRGWKLSFDGVDECINRGWP